MSPTDLTEQARVALAEGDPHQAMVLVDRWASQTDRFPPLDLVAIASGQLGLRDLRAAAYRAEAAPSDVGALLGLGYELVEVGLYGTAVPPLRAALELAPESSDVVSELAVALERLGHYAEALSLLRGVRDVVRASLACSYLLGRISLVTGDLETTRKVLRQWPTASDDPSGEAFLLRQGLADAVERADVAASVTALDDVDLRGWQFVLTGGLLTMLASENDEMNGRWAMLYDRYATCRASLERLKAVLTSLDMHPRKVLACPDRGSRVLSLVAGELLDLPVEWLADETDNALVIAYDLSSVEPRMLQGLGQHRPDQVLFAHAVDWTRSLPIAPDVVSLLCQVLRPPWEPHMYVTFDDAGSGRPTVHDVPADDSPPEELAQKVVQADPRDASVDGNDSIEGVLAFARAVGGVAAVTADEGSREPFRSTAVVSSNRFA